MSDVIFSLYMINGLAIFIQCVYTMYFVNQNQNNEQMDYLCDKICRLEKHILLLEQNLEDIEELVYKKNADLTQSTLDSMYEKRTSSKQKRLDDFIDYSE